MGGALLSISLKIKNPKVNRDVEAFLEGKIKRSLNRSSSWISDEPYHFAVRLQADAVQQVSKYVAMLRRVGKGLGVFHFDQYLAEQVAAAAA